MRTWQLWLWTVFQKWYGCDDDETWSKIVLFVLMQPLPKSVQMRAAQKSQLSSQQRRCCRFFGVTEIGSFLWDGGGCWRLLERSWRQTFKQGLATCTRLGGISHQIGCYKHIYSDTTCLRPLSGCWSGKTVLGGSVIFKYAIILSLGRGFYDRHGNCFTSNT